MSTVSVVVRITTKRAASVSTTPSRTPRTLTASASCSMTHATPAFDIPSDLSTPIWRVRSVTVVYMASRMTSMLMAAATPTTTLMKTSKAGTLEA